MKNNLTQYKKYFQTAFIILYQIEIIGDFQLRLMTYSHGEVQQKYSNLNFFPKALLLNLCGRTIFTIFLNLKQSIYSSGFSKNQLCPATVFSLCSQDELYCV